MESIHPAKLKPGHRILGMPGWIVTGISHGLGDKGGDLERQRVYVTITNQLTHEERTIPYMGDSKVTVI